MFGTDILDTIVKNKKPSNIDMIYYLFWDKGISYEEFRKLPIPYIIRILKTFSYVKEEEEKAYKKANRRR